MNSQPKTKLQSMLPKGDREAPPEVDISEAAIHQWIAEHAHPVRTTDPELPLTELAPIGDAIQDAVVVGLGETVRAGSEAIHMAHRVIRYLVEEKGFRALAFQDDESVIAELDAYVTGGEGDLTDLMGNMWNPWRAVEVREALQWVHDFNSSRADEQVRLVGLAPAAARPPYYDHILEALSQVNAPELDEVADLYEVIRTAHDINEHVQISRRLHPGGSYVNRARRARDLVATALSSSDDAHIRALAELIVDFHGSSAAGDYPVVDMTSDVADRITNYQRETGRKVIFWEGLAHTMVDKTVSSADPVEDSAVGTKLYHRLGSDYLSLLIAFTHGDIHGGDVIPWPQEGTLDARLALPQLDNYVLDLSSPRSADIDEWLRGSHRMRIISGIYDPLHDGDHYASFPMLDDMFAAIIRIGRISPSLLLSQE